MKKAITLLILTIILLQAPVAAQAADLPIDIEAVGREGEVQRDVLTAWRDIDLFSETSEERSAAIIEEQARRRAEIIDSLFTEPHTVYIADPHEALFAAAVENQMFSEPFQRRSPAPVEEDTEISLWIMVPITIGAASLGLIIAMARASRKRKRESESHAPAVELK